MYENVVLKKPPSPTLLLYENEITNCFALNLDMNVVFVVQCDLLFFKISIFLHSYTQIASVSDCLNMQLDGFFQPFSRKMLSLVDTIPLNGCLLEWNQKFS